MWLYCTWEPAKERRHTVWKRNKEKKVKRIKYLRQATEITTAVTQAGKDFLSLINPPFFFSIISKIVSSSSRSWRESIKEGNNVRLTGKWTLDVCVMCLYRNAADVNSRVFCISRKLLLIIILILLNKCFHCLPKCCLISIFILSHISLSQPF
jgi:hypothetical protein